MLRGVKSWASPEPSVDLRGRTERRTSARFAAVSVASVDTSGLSHTDGPWVTFALLGACRATRPRSWKVRRQ
jgi:hypothetical protein